MSAAVESRVPTSTLMLTISHEGPMELVRLTESLSALAASFARYADRNGLAINGDDVRLYVKEIRSGSIVVELVALAKTVPMVIEQARSILDFARFLSETIRYFRGEVSAPPPDATTKDAQDVKQLLGPVAADPKASLQIAARDNSTVNVTVLNLTSNDANAVQNRATNFVAQRAAPVSGVQRQMLFYWYQARDQRAAKAGDLGIIEAISARAVKTLITSDEVKEQMLGEALFRKAYVVDVDVQTISGKPSLYKILAVTESFDRDD
jgi:hypothetical protein